MAQKIAIIEDDMAISQMYHVKFVAEGFDVAVAENGKLGLALVEKMRPDIILLDLMMPEMTGGQMLTVMRQTDWGKNIKVVVLTNVSQDEAQEDVKGQNVSGFIVKAHYTPQQVVDMIRKILEPSQPPTQPPAQPQQK